MARSTAAGLDALRQEMSAVSKSLAKDMATDVDVAPVKSVDGDLKTPSGLLRHSILHGM